MRRRLVMLLGLFLSAIAIAILLATIDVRGALEILGRAAPLPLVAAVAVLGAQVLLRAVRWSRLLPASHAGSAIPFLRLVPPLLMGYLGNAVLPARLGEPMRAALVSRRERVGLAESLASVLLERIVDVATLALVAIVAAGLMGAPAWIIQVGLGAAAVAIGVLVLFGTVGVGPLVARARRIPAVLRSSRLAAAGEQTQRFAEALGGSERRVVIVVAAVLSTVAWILDGTIFWLAGQSLGVGLVWPGAMLVSAVAVLGTAVPSAPGYVGTFELAGAAVATALGVPGEAALALALLAHAITLLPLALGGAICIVMLGAGRPERDPAAHLAPAQRR